MSTTNFQNVFFGRGSSLWNEKRGFSTKSPGECAECAKNGEPAAYRVVHQMERYTKDWLCGKHADAFDEACHVAWEAKKAKAIQDGHAI